MKSPRLFGISLHWVPWAAGPVWMVLTLLMGWAAWTLFRSSSPQAGLHGTLMVGFIALCWMHPVYTALAGTFGYQTLAGLLGAVGTLVVALAVAFLVGTSSLRAAAVLGVVTIWLGMATVYLVQLLGIERRAA